MEDPDGLYAIDPVYNIIYDPYNGGQSSAPYKGQFVTFNWEQSSLLATQSWPLTNTVHVLFWKPNGTRGALTYHYSGPIVTGSAWPIRYTNYVEVDLNSLDNGTRLPAGTYIVSVSSTPNTSLVVQSNTRPAFTVCSGEITVR